MSALNQAAGSTRLKEWRRQLLLSALLAMAAPLSAHAEPTMGPTMGQSPLAGQISEKADGELLSFYAERRFEPLWVRPDGGLDDAAHSLLELVRTSQDDTLKPGSLKARALESALHRADEDARLKDLVSAELALSRTLVAYVKGLRTVRRTQMIYQSAALAPAVPNAHTVLQSAAAAESLDSYVRDMRWMHPLYAPLRRALMTGNTDPSTRAIIAVNLARIRALPAYRVGRHALVDTAGARLWMYENGRVVDSMKVVVGKADEQTPFLAGYISQAIVNPYWNVPQDLIRSRIAANVLDKGISYLQNGGYQVLSDWSDRPAVVNPAAINWNAVADGNRILRVRQLPGPVNFMGKVKFEFPNELGIYLHDTPNKDLMIKEHRQLSSGCIRLEDAQRFGRWLLRKPLVQRNRHPEQRVNLPEAVPVYITYLTAMPDMGRIALLADSYGHDARANAVNAGNRSR